jgi:SH3-like domain-containing protein
MNPRFLVSDGGPDSIHDDLRQWRKPDDVDGLRMRVQRALRTAETVMYAEGVDPETRLSAARAVVTAAREARKTIEARELEARIARLEEVLSREYDHSRNGTA